MWHGTDPNIERIRSVSNCQLSDALAVAWLLLAMATIFGHILGEDLELELCGDVVVSDQLRAGAAITFIFIQHRKYQCPNGTIFISFCHTTNQIHWCDIFSLWWPPLVVSIAECCQLSGAELVPASVTVRHRLQNSFTQERQTLTCA